MRLFLGVDGGQSSTTAVIGDETGRVLGVGVGGPCNHVGAEGGRAKFTQAIDASVGGAAAQAGLGAPRFESACLGFSGGPADKEPILREMLDAARLIVTTDARIALAGATGGEPGIVVIAGTGSIALGRNAAGRTARAGGWGFVFGDEGGAFDIARQGLRAILRHEEGWGPETALRAAFLAAGGASSANDLLHRFYTTEFPRARVAAFARIVDAAGREGDLVARGILRKAAAQLAALAEAVRRRLFQPGEMARVAHVGGVFKSAAVRDEFNALVALRPGNRPGPPVYGPAAGALLEAYRAVELKPQLSNLPPDV